MFADGIIEAMDDDGNMFLDKKLAEVFKESIKLGPDKIIETILAKSHDYRTNDDVTLMVIKRKL